jgi:hypothetical protein
MFLLMHERHAITGIVLDTQSAPVAYGVCPFRVGTRKDAEMIG